MMRPFCVCLQNAGIREIGTRSRKVKKRGLKSSRVKVRSKKSPKILISFEKNQWIPKLTCKVCGTLRNNRKCIFTLKTSNQRY